MSHRAVARQCAALFRGAFAGPPELAASAPGRVNLLGEHTDYNGGPVLPLAIERRTAVAVGEAQGWKLVSAIDGVVHNVEIDAPLSDAWTDYLVGVVRELRTIRAAPRGALVAVASTVPLGAGLSSSAAIAVAATRALSALAGRRLDAARVVDAAARAEHEQVGVRGGRMDQAIEMYGKRHAALL